MIRRTTIFLSSIRKYRSADAFMRTRRVPAYFLGLLTEGSGSVTVNGRARKLEALQPILLTPGSVVRFAGDGGELEIYLLLLEPVTVAKHAGRVTLADVPDIPLKLAGGEVRLRGKRQTAERIERLYAEARKPRGSRDDVKLQLLFQELYGDMLKEMLEQEQAPVAEESFRESMSYLRRHLHENISLERLADIAKLTPTSYSRKFKKATGATPFEYLASLRVEEAKARLSAGGLSVKEVSAQVGFNSEFYFSRVFKQSVGIAPNLYIKRSALRIAVVACSNFGDILHSLGTDPVARLNCFRYPGTDGPRHAFCVASALVALREARPELILIDRYHRELEERLKEVAPTVCIGHHDDWRRVLRYIAELTGRERNASLALDRLAERTYDARKRLRASLEGGSLTLLRITDRAVRIQGLPGHPLNELLYGELGLTAGSSSPAIDRKVEVEPEQLARLDLHSDYLFVQKLRRGPGSDDVLGRLVNSPFWQGHEAVRSRRVRFIPNWYAMSWTPGGRSDIIDSLLRLNDE
ncbi:helix-turn-helix domain-containing protein [Paenibacillus arenilitoris]|uniref:AraC family transcriptional regulator n=1 Tax=Paenibacillus arenilitoris TaxID=2772299 RepID=A0A927CN05_9BACL|nr:helix-turn-helix domain-containing protein [Paenibacillus arenilitoris]MBD2870549.1 AraC family transcriptional regulator [Paenibacillus arenilitoris]